MITSTANQQVKQLIQLNKKAKLRNERDVFVVEGPKMFGEAPKERIERAYLSESYFEKQYTGQQDRLPSGIACEVVQDSVFRAMCDTQTPQGVLCLVKQYHYTLEELLEKERPLFLVLENLQDPGNLGTIIRIADWFGIENIYCSPETADVYNPKVVQATMGSIARVKVLYGDLMALFASLPADVPVYGTLLDGEDIYAQQLDNRGFIVMGNEGKGISPELTQRVNRRLLIPNFPPERPTADSLNVAIATAITCSEFRRQERR